MVNTILKSYSGLISKVSNLISITNKIIDEIILIPYRKGDKWGFCTPDKKNVLECKFDHVNFFEGHLAEVSINKEYYFIDRNGKYISKESKIEESFNFENDYDEVYAWLPNGKKKCKNYEISNGIVAVKKNNKFGFVNLRNEIIIPFDYDWDSFFELLNLNLFPIFKDGIVFLKKKDKWGALDTNGKIVIPFIYDSYGFHDLIDFSPEEGFVDNFVNVKFNGKWGIIDRNGKTIIPFEYDMCYHFYKNLAVVKSNNKYGVIDSSNNLIIPFIYDKISNFEGRCAVIKTNNKYGLIDFNGNIILDKVYEYIEIFKSFIIVTDSEKKGIFDMYGNEMISLIYQDVSIFNNECFFVKNHDKWGCVDINNELIIDFKYDEIDKFLYNNYAKVWNGKKLLGYIDNKGTEYWED